MKTLYTTYNNFAKRLVMSLIVLMTVGVGSVWGADELAYTITFSNSANGATQIQISTQATTVFANTSTTYVTAKPFSNITYSYYGGSTDDEKSTIRVGKSGNAGAITIALSESGKVSATKVVVNCKLYNSSKGATLSVNNQTAQNISSSYSDLTFEINNDLASLSLATSQYAYIKSISVYKAAAPTTHTVTIKSNNVSYGTVDLATIADVANNAAISMDGNRLTVGSTTVTATPAEKDANYSYSFNNWSGIPSGNKVTANCTITANFTRTARALTNYRTTCTEPSTFTVTYNGNGNTSGSVPTDATEYAKDAQVTVLGNTGNLAKTGYTFSGWNTEANGTGTTTYAEGDKFTITENTTLYAKWTAKTATSLTWSPTSYSATIDADNTFPELTKSPADLTGITYSSSDETIATIDENTGEITLKAAGTTTITATFTETNTHAGSTASYTLTVHPSNCRWVETEIGDIDSGDEVVIAMTNGVNTWALHQDYYNSGDKYPLARTLEVSGNEITPISDKIKWNISGNATDGYILYPNGQTSTWLYCTGSSNTIKIGSGTEKNFVIENGYLKNINKLTYTEKGIEIIVDAFLGVSPSTNSWRHYPNTTTSVISGQTLKLYKKECLPTGKYWINYDLTNVVCTDDPIKNKISTDDVAVKLNFEAVGEHNELPATITVTNGSTTLAKNTDYTWEDGVLTILNPSQITDNITISIAAQKRKYTVTFNANGHGTAPAAQSVTAEGTASEPTAPEATGYTFVGWYTDSECTNVFDFATPITGDITLYAKWTVNKYTITFKNYDGTELQSSEVAYGETPSYTGETPTREQTAQYTYTFKGWSPTIASVTQHQVYTAQFTQTTRQYTVTWYDGTGNAHKTQSANYNATISVPTTDPEPCDDAYPHFIGWTADPIVGSTTTQPTLVENVKVTGDCDYYAVFAKGEAGENGSYTLDYDAESLKDSNKWGSYGTSYSHTAKDGSTWVIKAYKNLGMQINTGKNASIKIPSCPSPITSIEITGSTEKAIGLSASDYTGSGTITYIVTGQDNKSQTLDFAGKNVTNGYIVAKSGSISITKITINFTAPTNYTSFITTCCTSWSAPTLTYTTPLNAEERQTAQPQFGSGTTYGNATYTSSKPSVLSVDEATGEVTAVSKGTATITVTWEGSETYCSVSATSNTITVNGSYSVTFQSNGGTGTMEPQKADPSTQLIAKLNKNEFTKAGYVFVGWKDASGNAYTDEQENITLTKNLTLYAQWAPVVTLNDAGNEETLNPTAVGGTVTLPNEGANACSPYEFVGWTAVATGDWNEGINEPALVATTYTPNAPTTLYAVYKIQSEGNANAFKLSFEGGNGKTYYVGEYGSSPYLRGYSNITEADAVTFIRKKMYPNDDTKYYLYLEHLEEYLYCSSGNLYTTSNEPSESQGWVFHTIGDKIQIQAINQEKYLSYSDRDDDRINITTHSTGGQESFNMLSAVTSTYVASPLCNQEIEIIFETGNGDFVDNAPATNPLTVSRGDVITLPTCEYPGYEFMGWMKDEQQLDPSDIIGTYYTGDYTVDGVSSTITFYAYYKVIPEEVEFTGKDDVELLMYYYDGTENYYYAVSHAAERGELSSKQNCFNATTWTFTNVGNMQYHIQDETGKYLGAVNDNDNDLSLSNTPKVWNFTLVNGLWKMVCEDSPSRALMYISEGNRFTNAAITNEGNGAYSYVTLGICPYPTYTTNPILTQGFIVTNTAMVTSAFGQNIKAANALTLETRNIELPCTFTITAPNITFYDNTGAEVTQLTASAASEQFELYFAYKPTAENTMEYPTITIVDDEMKTYTIKNRIYARSLPNTFAVVAKVGGIWYALPSQGLNSTTPPAAYPVEVDDIADPIAVTAVPENADWSLCQVYEASRVDATKDRFVANGENFVFVNNEGTPKALNASASGNYLLTDAQYSGYYETNPGLYEWTPTTSDLETYTLTNAQRTDRTLNVSINTVFGVHYDNKATTEVRFLPIQGRYTPMAVQVVEWKENSVMVMYNGDPAQTASVSVNGGAVQTTELSGDGVQKDIAVYELAANDLATNPTQRLSITIGTEKTILSIPYIISGSKNDIDVLPGSTVAARQEVAKVSDLVILKDATLTAKGAKGNPYKFRNVTIYGGGSLIIPADNGFGANTLTMRVGGVENGQYKNLYPQLQLKGTLTNTSGQINLDYLTTNDFYYPLSVPYSVTISDIQYPVDIYGANVTSTNKGSFQFKYYDGAERAAGRTGWIVLDETAKPTLNPNIGYAIWGIPKKVKVNGGESTRQKFGIHRLPLKKAANDMMTSEKDPHETTIYVYNGSKRDSDNGWNYLGNPYLSHYGDFTTNDKVMKLGKLVWDEAQGAWLPTDTEQRYVVFTNDCQNYTAELASTTAIPAFSAFFIQADQGGAINFTSPNVATPQSLAARHSEEETKEITTGIILSGEKHSDRTGLLIADQFTQAYEFNADLSKFDNQDMNLYTISPSGKLAFMAINEDLAKQTIPLGYSVSTDGMYTIAFDEQRYSRNDIYALYLIDYDRNETTNLLHMDYNFYSQTGAHAERFALQVAFAPNTSTDVEYTQVGDVLLSREGNTLRLDNLPSDATVNVYDAVGHLVEQHTASQLLQLTLQKGYYLLHIGNNQNSVVIDTFIP